MGLRQPATKVWEIPEPTPALFPPSVPAEPETETVPVEPEKEREKERELEPAHPFWRRGN